MEKCKTVSSTKSMDLSVDDLVNLAEEISYNKCELMLLLALHAAGHVKILHPSACVQ